MRFHRRQVLPLAVLKMHPRLNRTAPMPHMWVAKFDSDLTALKTQPIYQQAPLASSIRAFIEGFVRFEGRAIKLGADAPITLLMWQPLGWPRERGDCHVVREEPRVDYRWTTHWICLTSDDVWTAQGGSSEKLALGEYVHRVHRLDDAGYPLPDAPPPEEDMQALGTLTP